MVTAVIVQARFGSTRLPGKILKPLGDTTPLELCLARCKAIPGADVVVCAVPDRAESAPIADVARRAGAAVFAGSEADVLARYHLAAEAVGADTVIRVTSDCPLIDPKVCGRVLALLETSGADYACNNMPPLWPHGLDCEAFPARHLAAAFDQVVESYEREHVSPWIRRNPTFRHANLDGPGGGAERYRWTLDYPEDFAFLEALWAVMGDRMRDAGWDEIIETLEKNPQIAATNADRIDAGRLSGTFQIAEIRSRDGS